MVLPVAVERGHGHSGDEEYGQRRTAGDLHLKDCLSYVLSLPVHCLALGCTTIGQIEDDVRIAQQFQSDAGAGRWRRSGNAPPEWPGPRLENWKRDQNQKASAYHYRDGALG